MKRKHFTRRNFLRLGVCGGAATLGYTALVEPFFLELVERELPIANLPKALKGKTLVQISDIHVSARVSSDFLIESLDRVAALKPDIVVYTGDFVTLDEGTEAGLAKVFPHLPTGKIGSAAILGNHDYGVNWAEESWAEKITAALGKMGIPVLCNEALDLGGLQVLGLGDLWAEKFDLAAGLSALTPGKATLASRTIRTRWIKAIGAAIRAGSSPGILTAASASRPSCHRRYCPSKTSSTPPGI